MHKTFIQASCCNFEPKKKKKKMQEERGWKKESNFVWIFAHTNTYWHNDSMLYFSLLYIKPRNLGQTHTKLYVIAQNSFRNEWNNNNKILIQIMDGRVITFIQIIHNQIIFTIREIYVKTFFCKKITKKYYSQYLISVW